MATNDSGDAVGLNAKNYSAFWSLDGLTLSEAHEVTRSVSWEMLGYSVIYKVILHS